MSGDAMPLLEPDVTATEINDNTESAYLVFRKGVCAHETILFSTPDGVQVLIDVDQRDIPIAVQVVESRKIGASASVAFRSVQEGVLILFALAQQMVVFHRANQQQRGNALINDALKDLGLLAKADDAVPA